MSRARTAILLLAIVGLSLGMRALLFAGLWDPDDFLYARYANDLRIGTFALWDWYAPRLAVFVPVAASFELFGVSDLSACLWPMVASTGALLALFLVLFRLYGVAPALVGCALLAASPGFAFRGNALRPDAIFCFGMFGAIAALLEADARERPRARIPWLVLSAALAMIAHLSREVALPLLALSGAIYLVATRRLRLDHLLVPALLLVALAAEAAWHASASGDPLLRFHILNDYTSTKSYALRPGFYAQPLLVDLLRGWGTPSLVGWALPVAIVAAACVRARRVPGLLLAWLAGWWIFLEFAPIQLVPFRPAFKEARYALPLLVLLHAVVGWALAVLIFPRSGHAPQQTVSSPRATDLPARFAAAALLFALLAGGLSVALSPPSQRVIDQFTTHPRLLDEYSQPLRDAAAVLLREPPRRTFVPPGLEGARLARAVAFYMGYPDAGSRDLGSVVPGSLFEQLTRPVAWRSLSDGYVVRWVQGPPDERRGAAPEWRELFRSPGSPALAIYAADAP